MPVHKTSDGKWQWGGRGKKYASRKDAERQAAAAFAAGYKGKKNGGIVKPARKSKPKK